MYFLRISIKSLLISLLVALCATSASAQNVPPTPTPKSLPCQNTIVLGKFKDGGILYKPENVHGGRGASFLLQNYKYWFGPTKKKIYDYNCKKLLGSVGLYSLGYAYGERYYARTGGSGDSGDSLYKKAMKAARKPGGIIVVDRHFSIRIKDFRKREGFVRDP